VRSALLLIINLFRLFAKVMLAPRPFAMCLKMLKSFCLLMRIVGCIFKRNVLLLLTANGSL
jgi:hypothetical protein